MDPATPAPKDEATLELAVSAARKDAILKQGKFNKLSEQYAKAATDVDEANKNFAAANKELHNFYAELNK